MCGRAKAMWMRKAITVQQIRLDRKLRAYGCMEDHEEMPKLSKKPHKKPLTATARSLELRLRLTAAQSANGKLAARVDTLTSSYSDECKGHARARSLNHTLALASFIGWVLAIGEAVYLGY